ncbi:Crp/Fnr family transcriptional regulator [Streptomyces sp. NPDC088197]|uniref:Crp/Fnr family transcriptional regulator n=1 Tax=unclassified Streptomyces TaxID=2593676 RepID=UPI0036ED111E
MLPAEPWRDVMSQGTTRRFRPRSVMLRQGDPGTHLLALTTGIAKVVSRDHQGVTTLLAFRGPGDLLGEVSVFDGRTRIADVIALSPCTAVVLEAERFRAYVERHGLVIDLMRQAMHRLRESDLLRAELLTLPLVTRLARTLVRLVELAGSGHGRPISVPATAQPDLPVRLTGLTQEELAQSIGVTRNAVGVALRTLRDAGAVETARRSIVIKDLDGLRTWADTA